MTLPIESRRSEGRAIDQKTQEGPWRLLRRVTSTGRIIPEIDGLRFIAIAFVLAYHINGEFQKVKGTGYPNPVTGVFSQLIYAGHFGVQLFFVISGFILSLPFVRYYCHGAKKPGLQQYYLRRLTRIEPPLIINLLFIFLLLIYVKGLGFWDLLPHLGASLAYSHNLVYRHISDINFVTWSLEIEAQFYLLAPLLCMMLMPRSPLLRWSLIGGATACVAAVNSFLRTRWPMIDLNLIGQLPYFLAGLWVAGSFASIVPASVPSFRSDAFAFGAWLAMAHLLFNPSVVSDVILPFVVAATYIAMLRGRVCKRLLSIPLLTWVGGMCYTIYLYHPFLKSLFKWITFRWSIGSSYWVNSTFQICVLSSLIIICCAFLFVAFERPFMIPNWPGRVRGWLFRRPSRY